MRHRAQHGFTLIEVLAVVVIILVIAGWIVTAARSAQLRGSRARALSEINSMKMGIESFKVEYGSPPRSPTVTEMETGGDPPINPLRDGNPNSTAYREASAFLYVALSGDDDRNGKLTQPDERAKAFTDFHSNSGMLNSTKDGNGKIMRVNFIQDPFGYSYGYSTAAAKLEDDFRAEAKVKGNQAARSSVVAGYNPDYDLWSTGGLVTTGSTVSDADRNMWIKNW